MRILALDIGGTNTKAALFVDGELTCFKEAPSVTETESCKEINAAIFANTFEGFDAIGVAITGQVDMNKQTVLNQYGVKLTPEGLNIPSAKMIEERTGKPVFLLNDSNAAALGEAVYGAGKGYEQTILLTYGTGVGGGIVMDGKLYGGKRGIAGEVGHMVLHADGDAICGCGNRGCYECYASTTALVREAKKVCADVKNGRELFELLPKHPELNAVIDAWIHEVVEGICTLVYIFNPPCIVLGGGIMEREEILEKVRKQFVERIMPTFSLVDIIPAKLGNKAGLYGAYAYVVSKIK